MIMRPVGSSLLGVSKGLRFVKFNSHTVLEDLLVLPHHPSPARVQHPTQDVSFFLRLSLFTVSLPTALPPCAQIYGHGGRC